MWGWQGPAQAPDGTGAAGAAGGPPPQGPTPGQQPQELSDMLQMLDQDLNMFTSTFE